MNKKKIKIDKTSKKSKIINDKINWFKIFYVVIALFPLAVNASSLVPADNSSFYYKIGGGQPIPIPAFIDQQTISLKVDGDIGLGYNCGTFNPKASIINSFNNIKNSFLNMSQTLIQNATAAIMEFPLYEVARANTTLYNLITNNEFGSWNQFALSTKSCQVMQNEIAAGKNPYHDWGQIAIGDDWKHYMSLGDSDDLTATDGIDTTDVNQVRDQVSKNAGKNGVPWVNGVATGRGGLYAGGQGQPTIVVLHDVAIAGYNVVVGNNRAYNDTSAPPKTSQDARLVETWPTPKAAAVWITNNLGDEKVTTYSSGVKDSTPGVGILDEIHDLTQKIAPKIAAMVAGTEEMSIQNLKDVSSPKVLLNKGIINYIRTLSPVTQSIFVGKVAQIMAMAKIADKVQLAIHLLQTGSQVPPVFANKAAQERIKQGLIRLNQELQNLLFNINLTKATAQPIADLVQLIRERELNNLAVQVSKKPTAVMNIGAIKTDNNGGRR